MNEFKTKFNIKTVKYRNTSTEKHIRNSYWKINDVIDIIKKNKFKNKFYKFNNGKTRISTLKNNLFIQNYDKNGMCKCDICSLEDKYVVLEKTKENKTDIYHFNLYTIDKETKQEIIFNIDHIKPVSKGGSSELSNLQLTCVVCNSKKANHYNEPIIDRIKLFFSKILKNLNM